MIYLDHAATTPLRPEAREVLAEFLQRPAANPASQHAPGRRMAQRIAQAREEFAALIGAQAHEIIWTSGATESNNLALLGRARFAANMGRHLVVPRTEHKAVIDPARHLAGQGWSVHWLDPGAKGICAAEDFAAAFKPETALACAMWANNETGHVHDIAAIAQVCAEAEVPLHVDAAQALGKLDVRLRPGIGSLSASGHKLGGPVGVGALYVRSRPRVGLEPLQFGGGQERGLRSGTLAAPQILAFVAAATAACAQRERECQHMSELREQLWQALQEALPDLIRNSPVHASSPHVLNISFAGVDGEALRASLPELAVSSGSACSSAQAESSYVLRALGHSDALANASLRFSLSPLTSRDQVLGAAQMVIAAVRRLRAMAPVAA